MRSALTHLAANCKTANPGQVLTRLMGNNPNTEINKQDLINNVIASAKATGWSGLPNSPTVYQLSYERWSKSIAPSADGLRLGEALELRGRLAVGLGIANPLEVGIHLHPVYGLPMIPGSALKGVCAHHCHRVWGAKDPSFQKDADHHRWLFGTTEQAGVITFLDAWWTPGINGPLVHEVITPHHQKWQKEGKEPPTDFDSPIPVPFLAASGKFLIALEYSGPKPADKAEAEQCSAWVKLAWTLLRETLTESGVGGKTTSGFGIFAPPPPPVIPRRKLGTIVPRLTLVRQTNNVWFAQEPDGKEGRVQGNIRPDLRRVNCIISAAIQDDNPDNRIYVQPAGPR